MPWTWSDDVDIGNEIEIGEAIRGMQGALVPAPAQALASIRGNLQQVAAGQFQGHVPARKRIGSPYKDSSHLGIVITQLALSTTAVTATGFALSGATTSYRFFKPQKVIMTESVTAHFTGSGGSTATGYFNGNAVDLLMVGALSGADNVFPNAPTAASGIDCTGFAPNSLGNGVSWPTISPGIPFTMNFLLLPSVYGEVATPAGFVLSTIDVTVKISIFGEQLR